MNDKIRIIKEKAIVEAEKTNPGDEEFLWKLFSKMLIAECVSVVKNTGTQCAYTTHDLGMVTCAIDNCARTLEKHFKE